MKSSMKKDALLLARRLREAGYESYLVGGCVRDALMGIRPKDYDIATSALPGEVMGLFKKTIPVGAQFGVVIVRFRGQNYEVATFREEWGYEDGRRPDGVRFTTARQDAKRRDFTINGLFYDPVEDKVIDHVGGQRDLERGVIRAIGDPDARFDEDKLRMLRAVRFYARLGFGIEKKTAAAIRQRAGEINQVSAERVGEEIGRVLTQGGAAGGIRMMDELLLLEQVLPEVKAMRGVEQPAAFHPEGDVFEHTMIMLESMKPRYGSRIEFAMAVLLHDVGKPPTFEVSDRIRFNGHASVGERMAAKIMRRLRYPNEKISIVKELVRDHLKFIDVPRMRPSTLKRFLRADHFDLHLELHRLDCLASHGDLSNYRLCRSALREMKDDVKKLRPPRLISGDDLIDMGLAPGPDFKLILTAVEDAQLEGRITTRDEALNFARDFHVPREE